MPIRWQCPLAINSRVYTSKADVYSFGVLVFEIFSSGGTPYAELQVSEVLSMVEAGHRLGRPSRATPDGVIMLIRECTQMNVAKRPAMAGVRGWFEAAVGEPAVRISFTPGGDWPQTHSVGGARISRGIATILHGVDGVRCHQTVQTIVDEQNEESML